MKIIPEDAEWIPLEGGSIQKPSKVVDAKLVYDNGAWSVYEYSGTTSQQVDVLSISMPSDDYYVTFNYQYEKKMELSAGWFNKVKFQAGVHDIPVHGVLQQ